MTTPGYAPVPFQNQDPTVAMTRVAQQELYATLLNHMQGSFGTESQIDMVMPVKSGETIKAGRVVSIDPVANAFVLGLVSAQALAYFAKPAGGYSGTPAAGNVYGDGILALPSCVSYKLATTEFVSGSYPANTPLKVVNTGDDKGKLDAGIFYTDTIVGITARGVLANYDKPGRSILEFFAYFLPTALAWNEAEDSSNAA